MTTMASFSRRTRTTTHTEYLLEAGAVAGEMYKTLRAAWADYCSQTGRDPNANMPDDWARIVIDDEHVIVRFTIDAIKPGEAL